MLLSRELHYLCLLLLGHSQMLVLGVGDTSETNPLLSCSNGRLFLALWRRSHHPQGHNDINMNVPSGSPETRRASPLDVCEHFHKPSKSSSHRRLPTRPAVSTTETLLDDTTRPAVSTSERLLDDTTRPAVSTTERLLDDTTDAPSDWVDSSLGAKVETTETSLGRGRGLFRRERMASVNREAKRTALEESLMKQLADMQTNHCAEISELEIKLHQREAAIKTLERAQSLRDRAVDEMRDELNATLAKLKEAETKLKKKEKQLSRKARSASPRYLPDPLQEDIQGLSSRRRLTRA